MVIIMLNIMDTVTGEGGNFCSQKDGTLDQERFYSDAVQNSIMHSFHDLSAIVDTCVISDDKKAHTLRRAKEKERGDR